METDCLSKEYTTAEATSGIFWLAGTKVLKWLGRASKVDIGWWMRLKLLG